MEDNVERKEVPKAENAIFGERLKKLRLAKGYKSRKKFAVALNGEGFDDINSIYRWEMGLRAPSFPTLKKIAALLGTSVSYLIGEIDYAGPLTPSAIEANRKKEDIISDVVPNAAAVNIPIVGERNFKKSEDGKIELSIDSYFPIAEEFIEPYVKEYGLEKLRILIMNGDAMQPRFKDGDYLLYVECPTAYEPDVVVAVYKSKVVVRGYFCGKEGIVLKSLNGEYQDIKTDASDLSIQGIVKARIPFLIKDDGFY